MIDYSQTKASKKSKSGWKLLTLILIVCIIGGLMYFGLNYLSIEKNANNIDTSKPSQTPTPVERVVTDTNYFVPVSGLKTLTNNFLSKVFATNTTIIALKDDEALLSKLQTKLTYRYFENLLEFESELNSKLNLYGIVNVKNLTPKMKLLSYDGKLLFERTTNLADYSLKAVNETKTFDEKKADTANYSHERLTKLGHTGSLISGRGVQYQTETKFGNDYTNIFKSTKTLFDKMDFVSGTIEGPFYKNGNYKTCADPCFTLVGPDKFVEGVGYSGIDLFSLAANHILDAGTAGLANVQTKLDEIGVKHTGASTINNDDAAKPILVEVNGMKIVYLAFNDSPGREQWAMENKPGAASISDWEINSSGATTKYAPNEERIKYFVDRAKALNPDYIFAIMHWGGREYINYALPYQERLADLLFDSGVDVILGDHPHWPSEIEFRKGKPVFYCTGNYIFDQMWSIETRRGFSIELNYLDKKLVNFKLHPHLLNLYSTGTVDLLDETHPEYKKTLDMVWENTVI